MGEATPPAGRRRVSELLADVACNLHDILRAELRLRQAQAREELRAFRPAGALITIGVLSGLLSAFFLLIAIVAALSFVISLWLAALLVAIVMGAACAVLLRSGANRIRSRTEKVAGALKERSSWTEPPMT